MDQCIEFTVGLQSALIKSNPYFWAKSQMLSQPITFWHYLIGRHVSNDRYLFSAVKLANLLCIKRRSRNHSSTARQHPGKNVSCQCIQAAPARNARVIERQFVRIEDEGFPAQARCDVACR